MTAPVASCITPVIEPDVFWAKSAKLVPNTKRIVAIPRVFESIGVFLHFLLKFIMSHAAEQRLGSVRIGVLREI